MNSICPGTWRNWRRCSKPGKYDLFENGRKTDSKHRVFYVPDQVSNEIYQSIIKEPEIHEVLIN